MISTSTTSPFWPNFHPPLSSSASLSFPFPMWSARNRSPRHDVSTTTATASAKSGGPSPSPNSSTLGRTNSMLQRVRMASAAIRTWRSTVPSPPPSLPLSSPGERRIVAYLTSLRVVRKTFEDCRSVMSILQGFRVAVDERDLSMDSGFLSELENILDGAAGQPLALPRVFVGGRKLVAKSIHFGKRGIIDHQNFETIAN